MAELFRSDKKPLTKDKLTKIDEKKQFQIKQESQNKHMTDPKLTSKELKGIYEIMNHLQLLKGCIY